MVRAIAVVGFALAVAAGSLADRAPARREPRVIDGYRVVAADFHVHGYPGDGALPWWDLAHEARRRGLDVIAVTNHNRVASGFSRKSILIIPGEEITMPGGHLAAVGVTRAVGWRGAAGDIARQVHAQGGIAIAAHPVGPMARAFDADTIDVLDGAEVAHPTIFVSPGDRESLRAFWMQAVGRRPAFAAVGSTDFHFTQPVGLCRTYLLVTRDGQDGVLEAVRAGRTVACDATGRVTGPAWLAPRLATLCAADMRAALAANTRADTVAAVLALLFLAALVVG